MSVSSVGPSAGQNTLLAAQKAAKAQYLKTGIDKDAAMGDPDHDAPKKVVTKTAHHIGTASASTVTASAATVASAVPAVPSTTPAATATAAYSAASPSR